MADRTSPETETFREHIIAKMRSPKSNWDSIGLSRSERELIVAALRKPDLAQTPDLPREKPDAKAVSKAFDHWCWTKDGSPIGMLGPGTAARQAFQGGVDWALAQGPDTSTDHQLVLSAWKIVGYDKSEKLCWVMRPEQLLAAIAVSSPLRGNTK